MPKKSLFLQPITVHEIIDIVKKFEGDKNN